MKKQKYSVKTKLKKTKGITLIALVITIIVLLILAGVTIATLTGDNGILTKAQQATINSENGEIYETLRLKLTDNNITSQTGEGNTKALDYLLNNSYINGDNVVDVDRLTEKNMQTGKGSLDTGDVYYIKEVEENRYDLIYVDSQKQENNLGNIFAENADLVMGQEPTAEEYFEFDPDTGGIAIKDAETYYALSGVYDSSKVLPIDEIVIPNYYDGKKVTTIGIKKKLDKYTYLDEGQNYTAGFSVPNIKRIYMSDNIINLEEICFEEKGLFSISTLEEIRLSNNITVIPESAFSATNLKEIELPLKLKEIGSNAFYLCVELTNIRMSNEIETINQRAFNRCDNLTDVYYAGTKEEWNKITIESGNDDLLQAVIHCSDGDIDPNV